MMGEVLFLAAVVGWAVAQVLICRRWGLPALAAATAVPLGGLYYLWVHTLADFPKGNPCEACRLDGTTCGGCEMAPIALAYAAIVLGATGAFFIFTGLIVGAIYHRGRRGA